MQEYINHEPELFMTDEEAEDHRSMEERKSTLVAQMNDRLMEDSSLEMEKRTFFEDSDIAKKALAEAMKKVRK